MYHKINRNDINTLENIAPGRVWSEDDIGEDYGHDELNGISHMPEVLIKVHSTEEVSDIMAYAFQKNIPVVVRGAGTGLVGGCIALEGGIMLEMTAMNRILELDEDNLTVTVQPGVLLMNLAEYAEARGFFYPPDPGEKTATIGGNISTNAGGMRAVKYGVTRDYVRGLTAVLPDGKIVKLGGKTVKNSSGYSLKDLLIGSEGTLAVITEAVLKLLPQPACSISLLVPFTTMKKALDAVPKIVRSKVFPTAIEYMSRETILFAEKYLGKQFPDKSKDSYLLFTIDGSSDDRVNQEIEELAELCLSLGADDAYIVDTDERKKSVWNARSAFLEAIKASTTEMDECDVAVPRSKVSEFILYTKDVAEATGLRLPGFGHAGDGNLHIYLCRDSLNRDEFEMRLGKAFEMLYNRAKELEGQVSGEHGIGWAKKSYLAERHGETVMALMSGIKKVFDPRGILNPGKVC